VKPGFHYVWGGLGRGFGDPRRLREGPWRLRRADGE
jgi:hypothetical protein